MLWGTPSGSALELSTVGHTVGHRGPLTVRFLLGKWWKRLLRVECWFRRGAPIPSPAPVFGPERELSALFSTLCKHVIRLRVEKPLKDAFLACSSTAVARQDRIPSRTIDRYSCQSIHQEHPQPRWGSLRP